MRPILDAYVGRYDLEDEGVTVIAREDTLLTIELPASWGLPKLRLHAETAREVQTHARFSPWRPQLGRPTGRQLDREQRVLGSEDRDPFRPPGRSTPTV